MMRVYIIRKSSRRTIFSRYLSPISLRSLIYVLLSPRIEEQKLGERGREEGERKTASRGDDGGKEHTARTGATVFMDMVVNIFVLSFCYVLYMRKERNLSRSKKPDEFSPSTKHKRIFHPNTKKEGFFFSFRIRVKARGEAN